MDDLPHAAEPRILEVERRVAYLEDEMSRIKLRARRVGQGLWDAWDEIGQAAPPPIPPTTVTKFASCGVIPKTLTAYTVRYGTIDIVWDATLGAEGGWTGCKQVSTPGFTQNLATCAANSTVPLKLTLFGSTSNCNAWVMRHEWPYVNVSDPFGGTYACPTSGSCDSSTWTNTWVGETSGPSPKPPDLTLYTTAIPTSNSPGNIRSGGTLFSPGYGVMIGYPSIYPTGGGCTYLGYDLYVSDNVYGGGVHLYFGGSNWAGCRTAAFVGHPDHPFCTVGNNTAIQYVVRSGTPTSQLSALFTCSWYANSSSATAPQQPNCPVQSTCAPDSIISPANSILQQFSSTVIKDTCTPNFTGHLAFSTTNVNDPMWIFGSKSKTANGGVTVNFSTVPI